MLYLPALLLLAVPGLDTLVPDAEVEHATWIADFDEARALAREQQKDLFVDFSGSDWCGWCVKLDDEVFRHELFSAALAKDYVLVKLDLPRSATALALVPDIERNRALVREYAVDSFPTILLMTAGGEAYGRTGYRVGGATAYLEHVNALREANRAPLIAAVELEREFAAAKADAKPALVERAIEQLEAAAAHSGVASRLATIAAHARTLDPRNESGLLARALRVILPSGFAKDPEIARGRSLDPENEAGLLELAVLAKLMRVKNERQVRAFLVQADELDALGPLRDAEAAKWIYSSAAQWKLNFARDAKAARKYARKARPLVQDDPELARKIDELLRS